MRERNGEKGIKKSLLTFELAARAFNAGAACFDGGSSFCGAAAFELEFLHGLFESWVDERIVFAVPCPRSAGNEAEVHEAPVYLGHARGDAEVVSHGRGDIDACLLVGLVPRGLSAENVFPIIHRKRPYVFPLCEAVPPLVIDLNPFPSADGFVLASLVSFVPGNDFGGFRSFAASLYIIIRKRDIERIELGCERFGRVGYGIPPRGIGVVVAAVVVVPHAVPAAGCVGHRVVFRCQLPYVEVGSGNVEMPRVDAPPLGSGPFFRVGKIAAVALIYRRPNRPGLDGGGKKTVVLAYGLFRRGEAGRKLLVGGLLVHHFIGAPLQRYSRSRHCLESNGEVEQEGCSGD